MILYTNSIQILKQKIPKTLIINDIRDFISDLDWIRLRYYETPVNTAYHKVFLREGVLQNVLGSVLTCSSVSIIFILLDTTF
ncbi:hypothetical protein RCH18_003295 [Flavobacterium sp. PL11]|nr:hypothetical protein [Flavobacterium sp. PL11]